MLTYIFICNAIGAKVRWLMCLDRRYRMVTLPGLVPEFRLRNVTKSYLHGTHSDICSYDVQTTRVLGHRLISMDFFVFAKAPKCLGDSACPPPRLLKGLPVSPFSSLPPSPSLCCFPDFQMRDKMERYECCGPYSRVCCRSNGVKASLDYGIFNASKVSLFCFLSVGGHGARRGEEGWGSGGIRWGHDPLSLHRLLCSSG